ncbi:MAG: (d)CMP kinase [Desulfocucumaceae bacterium]
MSGRFSIAIDGPAGAGKSTVARGVARLLGYRYIDTGAMYRAVTLLALEENININDAETLCKLAKNAIIDIIDNNDKGTTVLLNGVDVSEKVRGPLVTKYVSDVSKVSGVRSVLVNSQRKMAVSGGVVMEGRDIGTAVLPEAEYKFYIIASAQERAKRRARDFENMGLTVDLDQLTEDIQKRDFIDSSREINPLRPAEDAKIIDCTGMSAEEVIRELVAIITEGRS